MKSTTHFPTRRHLLQAGAGLLGLSATGMALAQDRYPARPVKIIIPLPAGGAADVSMRLITQAMQPTFGQSLVVDNKPGGAYVVAMSALTSAPADGYTLIHANATFLSVQAMLKQFDVFKQLVPIAGLGHSDMALTAGQNAPFKSTAELIAYGRANPGKLSYLTPGVGTLEHLAAFNFCKLNGIEAVDVPMKGGLEVVKALAQGEGHFGVAPLPLLAQFLSTGKVTPLFILNSKRNPAMPQLPTFDELGVKATVCTVWGGVCAPAGTPAAAVAYLQKAFMDAAQDPELQKKLAALGFTPTAIPGEALMKVMRDDFVWIAKAVKDADLKLS